MIREGDGPQATFIRKMDEKIACYMRRITDGRPRNRDDVEFTDSELKDYREAIACREEEILREANIILCTCITSSAKRIRSSTNVRQVTQRIILCLLL
jgi:hypothetical protein